MGENIVPTEAISRIVNSIIDSGQKKSKSGDPPLMFDFHGKNYLGAAHGMAGILYVLMLCQEAMGDGKVKALVKSSLDWVLSQQFESGNFPSSVRENKAQVDELVQWCHGGPGFIFTLCAAYKQYGDKKFLNAAIRSANDVWDRGLLRKGLGLCHGTSGNAYALLAMYRTTGDDKYIKQAISMAEFSCGPASDHFTCSNSQENLWNGVGAAVSLFADLLAHAENKSHVPQFPLFEL
ncbi:glutathione S-transferase LANCL1 [Pelomyxa schiedti]|nr:glutathione S-transferase LANCL1 [Pelomyxa schiedti]